MWHHVQMFPEVGAAVKEGISLRPSDVDGLAGNGRKREIVCVWMCVCVCVREREKARVSK